MIENSSKTPAEEAYKEWYGGYPSNGIAIDNSWDAFQAGYNAACEEPPQEEVNTLHEKEWKVDAKSLLRPKTLYELLKEKTTYGCISMEDAFKIAKGWLMDNTEVVTEDYHTVTLKLNKGTFGGLN